MRNSFRIVGALIICMLGRVALAESNIEVSKLTATWTGLINGNTQTIWLSACLSEDRQPLVNVELVLRGGPGDKHLVTDSHGCMSWQELQRNEDPMPETVTLKRQIWIWPEHTLWTRVFNRGGEVISVPFDLEIKSADMNRPETAAVDLP